MLSKFGYFLLMLASLGFNASLDAAEKMSAAALLAENIAQLKTYQADFEQRVINESGKEIDLSSGKFSIQRPNHFRWEILQKYPQLIVADGDHLWTHDIELEQVTIQNQQKVMGNSPLLLLTSNAEALNQSFEVREINIDSDNTKQMFELTPKQADSLFVRVHLLFEKTQLVELLMADSLGQQTSIKFSHVNVNAKLSSSLFSFEIPEGVDVVDSRERIESN